MTWDSTTRTDYEIAIAVVTWIKTARAAGYATNDWLPRDPDIYKSALFERLRAGKEPLKFPPPRGYACPWYALVEDRGPHFVGHGDHGPYARAENEIIIMQNSYEILERRGAEDMIVRDSHHAISTPYRFHLWFDANWTLPSNAPDAKTGGWFMRNVEFEA